MKKKLMSVLLIGMILLTACGGDSRRGLSKDEKKALKNYSEWAVELGLGDNKDFPIAGFSDSDGVKVEFEKEYGVAISDFSKLAKAHNDFVAENEGYFGDKKIVFKKIADSPTGFDYMFSNSLEIMNYGLEDIDIERDKTEQLRVAYIDASNDRQGSTPDEFANDVAETLIIIYQDYAIENQEGYDIGYLSQYGSLKNVIYCFEESSNTIGYEVLRQRIENEYPEISVFIKLY